MASSRSLPFVSDDRWISCTCGIKLEAERRSSAVGFGGEGWGWEWRCEIRRDPAGAGGDDGAVVRGDEGRIPELSVFCQSVKPIRRLHVEMASSASILGRLLMGSISRVGLTFSSYCSHVLEWAFSHLWRSTQSCLKLLSYRPTCKNISTFTHIFRILN